MPDSSGTDSTGFYLLTELMKDSLADAKTQNVIKDREFPSWPKN